LRRGVLALGIRSVGVEPDEVEAIDGLGPAVLEDLEGVRLPSFDYPPVLDRIGVNSNEVRAAAEDGTLLSLSGKLRRLLRRSRQKWNERKREIPGANHRVT